MGAQAGQVGVEGAGIFEYRSWLREGKSMSAVAVETPTVFVVDDNADICAGIKALLESVGLRCQTFGSPAEYLQRSPIQGPSCLILDVRLQKWNGLDFQDELAREPKSAPVVIITGYGDIPMSVRAMKAGAVGFLTKPVHEQELLDAVFAALDQHRAKLENEGKCTELRGRVESLSAREREVLPLVTAGLLNKQIASEMGRSEVTVKVHRHKMMAKLQAKTVPDLVRMADALGIRRKDQRR
jgi:FixJ family two-component response regulator